MREDSKNDLFKLSDSEPFVVKESSLDDLIDSPVRIPHGIIILCLSGNGRATVNFKEYVLEKNTQVFLLPQSIITLNDKSEDFNTFCFSFSLSMFHEAAFPVDSGLFGFLKENAVSAFSPEIFQGKKYFFLLMQDIFNDRENKFRNKISVNYLQNYFLDTFDKIDRNKLCRDTQDAGRKEELFKKFVHTVHQNYMKIKEVKFYANELFISTRYLSGITQSVDNCTAKEFIDKCVIQEIKLLLRSTSLSVQEISDRLNFQDQSDLSRFFKKRTGLSPTAYRDR